MYEVAMFEAEIIEKLSSTEAELKKKKKKKKSMFQDEMWKLKIISSFSLCSFPVGLILDTLLVVPALNPLLEKPNIVPSLFDK